jgi:hypothetical protein
MRTYRVLAIALVFVIAACGGDDGGTEGSTAATTTTTAAPASDTTTTTVAPASGTTTTTAEKSVALPAELLWYAPDVSQCGVIAAVFEATITYRCPGAPQTLASFEIATGTPAASPDFDSLEVAFDGTILGLKGGTVSILDPVTGERVKPAVTLPERADYLVGDHALSVSDGIATVTDLEAGTTRELDVVSPPRNADFDESGDMIEYVETDGALLALRGGGVERLDPATLSPVWSVQLAGADGSPAYVPSVWRSRKAWEAKHLVPIRTAGDTAIIDIVTGEVVGLVPTPPSKIMDAGVSYEEDGGGICSGGGPIIACYLGFDGSVIGSTGLEDNGSGIFGPTTGLASGPDDLVVNGRFFVTWPGGGPTQFAERDPAEVWSVEFADIDLFPQGFGCDLAVVDAGLVGHCGGVPMLIA